VLTAAHAVDTADSLSFDVGGTVYAADDWGTHPYWDGGLFFGYDLALVHLDTAVAGVTAAERFTDYSVWGETLTYVGFGKTGVGSTGATVQDDPPVKRAGTNNAELSFFGSLILSDFDDPSEEPGFFEQWFPQTAETALEFLTAAGDSGGGVFVDDGGGNMLLAGVSSFVVGLDGEHDSDYGDWSGAMGLYFGNTWIDDVLAGDVDLLVSEATGIGQIIDGMMVATSNELPEPATVGLLSVGALVLVRKRNKR
jgi:hypothetical protein